MIFPVGQDDAAWTAVRPPPKEDPGTLEMRNMVVGGNKFDPKALLKQHRERMIHGSDPEETWK